MNAHSLRTASLSIVAFAGLLAPGCELHPSRDFARPVSMAAGPPTRTFTDPGAEPATELELPPAPPAEWSEPAREEVVVRRLSNGMTLHAVPRPSVPGATVFLVFGTKSIPSPTPTAWLYLRSALEGFSPWSVPRLEGASVYAVGHPDFMVIGITALSPVIDRAVARVFPGVIEAPLHGVHVDNARLAAAGGLSWREPERRAYASAFGGIFPMPHPYGEAGVAMLPEAFNSIPVASVTAFRDASLTTENMAVVAAGNVDVSSLAATLDRALAGVPRTPVVQPSASSPSAPCAGQVLVIDDGGSQQMTVNQSYAGVPANHADASALQVLAAAAGGSISTHLNASLRRGRGLTYGFSAEIQTMRAGGLFSVYGALDPSRRVDGLKALAAELEALARTPLTDEDLRAAQISAAHATSRSGGTGTAFRLAESVVSGVPLSDASAIRAVTAEQVRDAAARYLSPAKRCLVVVGNAGALEQELRGAGFGPVSRAPR